MAPEWRAFDVFEQIIFAIGIVKAHVMGLTMYVFEFISNSAFKWLAKARALNYYKY